MSIGYKVRKHREIKGWSQDELAQRLEVTQGTISNIESDKCVPSSLLLHKIAKELDVDLISLFERSYTHVEKNEGDPHRYRNSEYAIPRTSENAHKKSGTDRQPDTIPKYTD